LQFLFEGCPVSMLTLKIKFVPVIKFQ